MCAGRGNQSYRVEGYLVLSWWRQAGGRAGGRENLGFTKVYSVWFLVMLGCVGLRW